MAVEESVLQQTLCHHAPRWRRRYRQKISEERSHPKGHHIERQDQSSMEGSPSWESEPCGWEEKEDSKQQDSPNPKWTKETSNSEVHLLTIADIPDIVAAVADVNQRDKPVQVSTSRCTLRSGNKSSQDDSPWGNSQPSSDEESGKHEYFGKCNRTTRCTLY